MKLNSHFDKEKMATQNECRIERERGEKRERNREGEREKKREGEREEEMKEKREEIKEKEIERGERGKYIGESYRESDRKIGETKKRGERGERDGGILWFTSFT